MQTFFGVIIWWGQLSTLDYYSWTHLVGNLRRIIASKVNSNTFFNIFVKQFGMAVEFRICFETPCKGISTMTIYYTVLRLHRNYKFCFYGVLIKCSSEQSFSQREYMYLYFSKTAQKKIMYYALIIKHFPKKRNNFAV